MNMDIVRQKLSSCFPESNAMESYKSFSINNNKLTLFFNNIFIEITYLNSAFYVIVYNSYRDMIYKSRCCTHLKNSIIYCSRIWFEKSVNDIILEFTTNRKFKFPLLFAFFSELKEIEDNYDDLLNSFGEMNLNQNIIDTFSSMKLN